MAVVQKIFVVELKRRIYVPVVVPVSPLTPLPLATDAFVVEVINKDVVTIRAGQPVTVHGSGLGVILARANVLGFTAYGIAIEDGAPLASFKIRLGGVLSLPDWTLSTGTISLLAKTKYFLDIVSGKLTAVAPLVSGNAVQPVGTSIGPTQLDIEIDEAVLL